MNLFNKLPLDVKILIYEFNVEHRPNMKLVFNELFFNIHKLLMNTVFVDLLNYFKKCDDCFDYNCVKIVKEILYNKYIFCSYECLYSFECDIRKTYKKYLRDRITPPK